MSSQSPGGANSISDQISTDDDEDKKFVSQAVTFVIGHARNGFVSLCASVASLLKEQTRLKQEVDSLQKEVSRIQSPNHNNRVQIQAEVNVKQSEILDSDLTLINHSSGQQIPKKTFQTKPISSQQPEWPSDLSSPLLPAPILKSLRRRYRTLQLPYRKVKGCICSICSVNKFEPPLMPPLEKGMKVIIRGELCGTVEYIGHVEALHFPEIQVGIKFSEAIGNSDGTVQNKTYFRVQKNYGMFIPLSHVLCVVQ